MKRIILFCLWFFLMFVFTLPIAWYIHSFANISPDISEHIGLLIPVFLLLLFILSDVIRELIINILKFPLQTIKELETYFKNKRIKKYSKRNYILIKTKHHSQ